MRLLIALAWLLAGRLPAQTTQSIISGRVIDANSATPIGDARIDYQATEDGQKGSALSSSSGYYILPLLSPGDYHVRVTAARYQSQELFELRLPVAASLDLDFRLRLLAGVWELGLYGSVLPQGSRRY